MYQPYDLSMNFLRVEAMMRGRVNIIRIEFSRFHFLRPLYFGNNHRGTICYHFKQKRGKRSSLKSIASNN